jgi:predicted Zn-dependent protease with MMP-like domain
VFKARNSLDKTLLAAASTLVILGSCLLGLQLSAGAAVHVPQRNTSSNPNCANQPARPIAASNIGFTGRYTYPVVGGIDANGCDSWPYELAPSSGVAIAFFFGVGFQAGQHAFEYGTKETTELLNGHQLIRVVNPTSLWRRTYKGYDSCTTTTDAGGKVTTCIAPALERRPDDLILYIPFGILVGGMLLFVVHFTRPAGPIRMPRHYRRKHKHLAGAVSSTDHQVLAELDVKQLQRRLRHLEKFLSPQLSQSQHHWFRGLVGSGRHGLALESLSRWLAESRMPVPDHMRQEVLWIASSLEIEREVRPILDVGITAHETSDGLQSPVSTGFDVPLVEFKQMVADAVDSLPAAFGHAMSNVAVVVDEEAQGRSLFGLYEGVPLSKARYRQWSIHPDKITIYRRTICESCTTESEVRAQVYRTVIHEIAHHFGINDPRLRELGW